MDTNTLGMRVMISRRIILWEQTSRWWRLCMAHMTFRANMWQFQISSCKKNWYQICSVSDKGIDLLENVQRRFTKSVSKLHYLPYTTRLSSLNIPTLSCRRSHIDLCTVYRILHYHTCLDPFFYFSLRTASITLAWSSIYSPQTIC